MNNITFFIFIIFIPFLVIILLMLNLLLAVHKPYSEKVEVYECGFHAVGEQTRSVFNIQFFLLALLFMVFDVELILYAPIVVTITNVGLYGLIIAIAFFILLTIGFIFEIGKGALNFNNVMSLQSKNTEISVNNNSSMCIKNHKNTHFLYTGKLNSNLNFNIKNKRLMSTDIKKIKSSANEIVTGNPSGSKHLVILGKKQNLTLLSNKKENFSRTLFEAMDIPNDTFLTLRAKYGINFTDRQIELLSYQFTKEELESIENLGRYSDEDIVCLKNFYDNLNSKHHTIFDHETRGAHYLAHESQLLIRHKTTFDGIRFLQTNNTAVEKMVRFPDNNQPIMTRYDKEFLWAKAQIIKRINRLETAHSPLEKAAMYLQIWGLEQRFQKVWSEFHAYVVQNIFLAEKGNDGYLIEISQGNNASSPEGSSSVFLGLTGIVPIINLIPWSTILKFMMSLLVRYWIFEIVLLVLIQYFHLFDLTVITSLIKFLIPLFSPYISVLCSIFLLIIFKLYKISSYKKYYNFIVKRFNLKYIFTYFVGFISMIMYMVITVINYNFFQVLLFILLDIEQLIITSAFSVIIYRVSQYKPQTIIGHLFKFVVRFGMLWLFVESVHFPYFIIAITIFIIKCIFFGPGSKN